MSTNKYKWLTLGLTSIVISGCAVGNKANLNLGIADAFRKSKSCLFKKKLSYGAPSIAPGFGYATPVDAGTPVALPSHDGLVTLSDTTIIDGQSAITSSYAPSDCNCNSSAAGPVSEFYMPSAPAPQELVNPPIYSDSGNSSLGAALPFEASNDNSLLENPLPAAVDVPSTPISPSIEADPTEEEGVIESLDSASIDNAEMDEELDLMDDEFDTPEKDESSILDTAARALEAPSPTSAGHSVVDQRSKMLTLTARPVQSHQVFDTQTRQKNAVEMQQVTHKRHFRPQNALRPHRQKLRRAAPLERTAEAPAPAKFKPLPVLSNETPKAQASDTGLPALNSRPSSGPLKQSSTKMQRLTSPVQVLKSETEKESVIKIARLPILKAESTSSAAIGSLRNFTNVRDLDPKFDKGYYSRKKAEAAAIEAAQLFTDSVSRSTEDVNIER